MDPTYTGKNRSSLKTIVEDDENKEINFENLPEVRLGGRIIRNLKPPAFKDEKNLGYGRFDSRRSVLFANIDAVMNLTQHVGGYMLTGTEDNNQQFYSLLFEDNDLALTSYIQWRRPLSVARVIIKKALTKPFLQGAQTDIYSGEEYTGTKIDVGSIIDLMPCSGYHIISQVGTDDNPLSLRDILVFVCVSLMTMNKQSGKAVIVFPYEIGPPGVTSGPLTSDSIIDLIALLNILFHNVWLFRPYMCYSMLCVGFSGPKDDPKENSPAEIRLVNLWESLGVIMKYDKQDVKISGRIFTRIFYSTLSVENKPLPDEDIQKIYGVLGAKEPPLRDRVEVLSRWQLSDQADLSLYPF